jgi:hypothetical protein
VTPLPMPIYRGLRPINLQLTRASKTAIPLRDNIVLLDKGGEGSSWSILREGLSLFESQETSVDWPLPRALLLDVI